jgi:tRNA threonylcarbamoyladenosine biosynthesis protein TsaE
MASVFSIVTDSAESTQSLGRAIGDQLTTSVVIGLTGDLGSGKTVFVKGLAVGLSVPDGYTITSPSYTLINEYPGRLPLYHVDLYRLGGATDLEEIGLYDIFHGQGVIAVEWADRLDEVSFPDHLQVHFETGDDDSRHITLTAYGLEMNNLIKSLGRRTAGSPI